MEGSTRETTLVGLILNLRFFAVLCGFPLILLGPGEPRKRVRPSVRTWSDVWSEETRLEKVQDQMFDKTGGRVGKEYNPHSRTAHATRSRRIWCVSSFLRVLFWGGWGLGVGGGRIGGSNSRETKRKPGILRVGGFQPRIN